MTDPKPGFVSDTPEEIQNAPTPPTPDYEQLEGEVATPPEKSPDEVLQPEPKDDEDGA